MNGYDPSKDWDRHCAADEQAALYDDAARVKQALLEHGVNITVVDAGKKLYFHQGNGLSAEWVKNEDGEIDVLGTAVAAMVEIAKDAFEQLKAARNDNPKVTMKDILDLKGKAE